MKDDLLILHEAPNDSRVADVAAQRRDLRASSWRHVIQPPALIERVIERKRGDLGLARDELFRQMRADETIGTGYENSYTPIRHMPLLVQIESLLVMSACFALNVKSFLFTQLASIASNFLSGIRQIPRTRRIPRMIQLISLKKVRFLK